MRVIPKDKVIFSFNANNKAFYEVENGETFWVETDDCYSGQIKNSLIKRPDIDISIMDCSVGPIDVKGAMPGDTLCVEVLAIEFAPQGVMVTSRGLGVLGDKITEPDTKVIPIKDGFAHFSDEIRLPLTPMIGVCGVAPKPGLDIHCAVPGDHGSNMDTKMVKVGSKVYLPVSVEGAGLAVGDLHACMGDGELSGTGIETPGRICIKTTVYKDRPVERPVIETRDSLYFIASDKTLEAAIKVAVDDTVSFLMKKLSLSFPDAYRLLSATCDIQISQVVNDMLTVRVHCPKFDTRIDTI
ncbi:acetamidase/formamidase family protein [Oscillospiraceae bacterium LTW-04]|nr:acetamidase/formamidase family protein [Oscillospiraceae bacterium MB24-C1]